MHVVVLNFYEFIYIVTLKISVKRSNETIRCISPSLCMFEKAFGSVNRDILFGFVHPGVL